MSEPAQALAAVIAGRRYRLPEGALALPGGAPAIRPLPGAAPPLLGLATHRGEALPALAPGSAAAAAVPDPLCWAVLPGPPRLLLGATALQAAEAGDPPLPGSLLQSGPGRPPSLPVVAAAALPGRAPAPAPDPAAAVVAAGGPVEALRLVLAEAASLDLPTGVIRRVVPGQAIQPLPGRPEGALGYAATAVGDALVLDPAALAGPAAQATPAEAALLVVFDLEGLCLALPCARVAPAGDPAAATVLLARLGGPALRRAREAAPRSTARAPDPAVPMRQVLVATAGGLRFALPAEAVVALLPPQSPMPPPPGAPARIRGLCAHRGDVLPVIEAAERLGGAAAAASPARVLPPRPLLRLAVSPPVALAIDAVPALHRLPLAGFTAVAGEAGLVGSVTRLDGVPLPVCRPAALAALGEGGGAA